MAREYTLKLAHGAELELRYTFKALRFLEKTTGGHFFSDSISKIGTDYVSGGIAAGLLWKHPDITVGKVDSIIEQHLDAGGALPQILDGLIEALKQSGVLQRPTGEEAAADERPTSAVPVEP